MRCTRSRSGSPLYFGIGIHTGHSVLGMVGGANRIEFAALGEATDDSKFLQENAEPGEIIISADTFALVKNHCDAEAIPPTKMKAGFEHTKSCTGSVPAGSTEAACLARFNGKS